MNSEHTARLAHGFCSPDLSSLAPFRLGWVARLFKVKILRTGSESVPPCRGSRGFGPLVVTFAGRLKGAAPVLRCPWASYFGRCMASARHFLGSRNHGLGVRLHNLGHCYSPWLNFKGRQSATAFGILLVLIPMALAGWWPAIVFADADWFAFESGWLVGGQCFASCGDVGVHLWVVPPSSCWS